MARREPISGLIEELSGERRGYRMASIDAAPATTPPCSFVLELALNSVPCLGLNDRRMLSIVGLCPVPYSSGADRVGQDVMDMAPTKETAAASPTIRCDPSPCSEPKPFGLVPDSSDGAKLPVEVVEYPDRLSFALQYS